MSFVICDEGAILMRLADHLSEEDKKKLTNSKPRKKTKRRVNKMSQKDWEEVMGVNRDTFKRHKGAIRRR